MTLPSIILQGSNFYRFQENYTQILCLLSCQDQEDELDDLYSLITIEVKGHDKAVLQSYAKFMTSAATELDLQTYV